ncbi:acyl-CoA dehydrogenase family protein [Parafrankia discariae]|uniref:acyl-CoA dehydrogenase family protein n=1 Tax=Parafrankia discariae TaxID=365528 RepID=UPI00037D04F4
MTMTPAGSDRSDRSAAATAAETTTAPATETTGETATGPSTETDTGPDSDEGFRGRLRDFLVTRHPGRPPKKPDERVAWTRAWLATLFDHGYAGPSWPREFGGMDLSFGRQVIYQEELARARVPGPLGTGLNIAAPTIIRYGTQEQKERWLAPMLRGDRIWVQGYSEPGAGSDLPSLRTTARRQGDEYVVNGQKVWTSHATTADIIFTLVRTGTQQSRQRGISYLIVDTHAPGVQVRPLRDLTGGYLFAEVFFDDVRVPVADRVGAENEGWALARTSLGHERAAGAMNQAALYRRVLTELEQLARERGLLGDAVVRDRFADLEIRVRVMRYNAQRVISDILAKGEPGPTSSVSRLLITEFEQEIHELAVDLLGPAGLLLKTEPGSVQGGRWLQGFLRTRASTIGAGTREIQLNTLAEQVLGLPHDPAMPPR